MLGGTDEAPVYVPVEVQIPDGARRRFTSRHGRWVSVHDVLAEQFEVELLVPLPGESETVVAAASGDVGPSHPRT
ncbi:MAG: hypothetical protein K0A98_04445 [Trueperaceae bacterium]|nr:hypothetical protein [Trueperaceae bacterium]